MRAAVALLCVLACASVAQAHGLNAEAHAAGGQVVLELWFDDKTPAASANCTATRDGQEVASGKTDVDGVWRFDAPSPGTYLLEAVDVSLHRARVTLTVSQANMAPVASDAAPRTPARLRKPESQLAEVAVGILILFGVSFLFAIAGRNRGKGD